MNADNRLFVNAVRGPVIMITIGVLFLLDRFTAFQFTQTWPVILIVVGALALAGGGAKPRVSPAPSSPDFYPPHPTPSGPGTYSQTPYGSSPQPGVPPNQPPSPGVRR